MLFTYASLFFIHGNITRASTGIQTFCSGGCRQNSWLWVSGRWGCEGRRVDVNSVIRVIGMIEMKCLITDDRSSGVCTYEPRPESKSTRFSYCLFFHVVAFPFCAGCGSWHKLFDALLVETISFVRLKTSCFASSSVRRFFPPTWVSGKAKRWKPEGAESGSSETSQPKRVQTRVSDYCCLEHL